jgi:hypothetical protein
MSKLQFDVLAHVSLIMQRLIGLGRNYARLLPKLPMITLDSVTMLST